MSIEISQVQRLRVSTEPSSAFATDRTGTLANFTDVPFVEGSASATLTQNMLNPEHAQQYLDGYPTQVLGTKACQLSFSINLAPTGTSAASTVTAVQSALGIILKATMGGEVLSTGDDVQAGTPTATTFDVADAAGNAIAPGQFVGWANSSGNVEARPVKTVSTNAVTLRMGFSAAPSTGNDILGSATYFLGENPDTSLQFILEGVESQDRWVLRGLQLESMSIDLPLGELPRVTFTFQGATWTYGASAATDLTASALSAATYSNVSVIHTTGNFYYQTNSTATLPTALAVSSVSLEPALAYIPVPSPSGTETISRYRRNRVAPVISGSFTLPYQDTSYFTDRDNKTLKQIVYQLGTVAGSVVALDLPTVQVTDVQKADANSIASQTVSWQAQTDAVSPAGVITDIEKSAFRIAFI